MSRWSLIDDSDESLSDYQTGLNNVFSVDQLVAVNEQVAVEKEDKGKVSETEFEKESYLISLSSSSIDSSSSGGAAIFTNLHDANELSALSTLTNSQIALAASQTESRSTVEELEDPEDETHETNEMVEEVYESDFEPSEECEEQLDMTTTTSCSSSTLHENCTEEESGRQPDHLNTCSVHVQTDPISPQLTRTREAMRTRCPSTDDPECLVQDILYSQLELTRQLMEQSLQLARNLTMTDITPSYHYTTLQETKQVSLCILNTANKLCCYFFLQYIEHHKPRVLTFSEAKSLLQRSSNNF